MNLTITALLTARGNNTMKDKNIRLVAGHPLIYYPALAANNSKYINNFFVSSDDKKILDIAGNLGYIKIKRPDELAKPNSQHIDSINHALRVMSESYNITTDILVVLLGNCATIKTEWIDSCIELIKNNDGISAVVPVLQDNDHHPYRAKRKNKNGFLEPFFDFNGQNISTNRQDLDACYFLCHNFWVLNLKNSVYSINKGQAPWTFMGNNIEPYIIEQSFDVHEEDDLIRTEKWLKVNNITDDTRNKKWGGVKSFPRADFRRAA